MDKNHILEKLLKTNSAQLDILIFKLDADKSTFNLNTHAQTAISLIEWAQQNQHHWKNLLTNFQELEIHKPTNTEHKITTQIIKQITDECRLGNWYEWFDKIMAPEPCWSDETINRTTKLQNLTTRSIWPQKMAEIKISAQHFAQALNMALEHFMENSAPLEPRKPGGTRRWFANKYYKTNGHFNPNYDKDLASFMRWMDNYHQKILITIKAANWFTDTIRRDIDPTYLMSTGRFITGYSSNTYQVPEYTTAEKSKIINQSKTTNPTA